MNILRRFSFSALVLVITASIVNAAERNYLDPVTCSKTGEQFTSKYFIDRAINIVALGTKTVSRRQPDGTLLRFEFSVAENASIYAQQHPGCCEIYTGNSGDWFTPLAENSMLSGQRGVVVRLLKPVGSIENGNLRISYRRSHVVFDDCGNQVKAIDN